MNIKVGDHVVFTPYGKKQFPKALGKGVVTRVTSTVIYVKGHTSKAKSGGAWHKSFWELETPEICELNQNSNVSTIENTTN